MGIHFSLGAPSCAIPAGVVGHAAANPLQHLIVIMQENHSFDSYFGKLNEKKFYGENIDGVTAENSPQAFPANDFCPKDPDHSWEAAHQAFHEGKLDRFGVVNADGIGKSVFAYQTESELPFYYALANQFSTADRYFSSVPGPTFPNRYYLYAGTSFGHIRNDDPPPGGFTQATVFDSLTKAGISWKYYHSLPGHYLDQFATLRAVQKEHFARIRDFAKDIASGKAPQVIFLESAEDSEDEHPPANVKWGQQWVQGVLQTVMQSKIWPQTAVFLTWDENGGFADHVAPPEACAPDDVPPSFLPTEFKAFDHLGFRVPFVVISPYAKRHFVSHTVFDHTSILKFIEDQYGLPFLSRRDANSNSLSEFFDFDKPANLAKADLPDLTKLKTVGCTDPQSWAQNVYNRVAHWFQEFWADLVGT